VRQFGAHWTRVFSAAFGRLPQRVVWRHYDNETSTSVNDTERHLQDYDDRLATVLQKRYSLILRSSCSRWNTGRRAISSPCGHHQQTWPPPGWHPSLKVI